MLHDHLIAVTNLGKDDHRICRIRHLPECRTSRLGSDGSLSGKMANEHAFDPNISSRRELLRTEIPRTAFSLDQGGSKITDYENREPKAKRTLLASVRLYDDWFRFLT